MPSPEDPSHQPLQIFHPLVAGWFSGIVGTPTDVQHQAWPRIAAGEHVLISAPTGSGKTLSAFLWALDRLITGAWAIGGVRVVYISPLKALNNDVERNLLRPLSELRRLFAQHGKPFPDIRVAVRSGDTPQNERQRMLRKPPEILITTPESLNILLTSRRGRALFYAQDDAPASAAANVIGVTTVILDEIHAVAGSRRGTHLMTAVERLAAGNPEMQRIALSATVRPLETVADFVGGFEPVTGDAQTFEEVNLRPRKVSIVESRDEKRVVLGVRGIVQDDAPVPGGDAELVADEQEDPDALWQRMCVDFKRIIRRNRSTLLFTNSRALAEKIARFLNEGEDEQIALCHHGSLSRDIRLLVEERLKAGELPAIVATSSLELGIDIGSVDEVIMIQTPRRVSSTLQRIGRAGHGVGETSRGWIYPAHGRDVLDAAVMARAVDERSIEPVHPPDAPLDVLAQVIVSMCVGVDRDVLDLYVTLRQSYSYRNLSREGLELVLDMLSGRFADSRVRELRPRIAYDRIRRRVRARDGADRVLYMAGGTIPDRGYYDLRVQDSRAKIGQLDEEFVWERSLGDVFHLGNRYWKIADITHNDVLVVPGEAKHAIVPFWRAEDDDRGRHLCDRLGEFLEDIDGRLAHAAAPEYRAELLDEFRRDYFLDESAAEQLLTFLETQRSAANAALPHRRHVLVEHFQDPLNRSDQKQVILHTLWGGRANRPLSLALRAAWKRLQPFPLQTTHNDDAVLLILPDDFAVEDLWNLVLPEDLEDLLRESLETSGYFGARFRENAGRALLLPPSGFDQRLPLWFNRLRSKKLLEAVSGYNDFPIMLETWRTCLRDEFELDTLRERLDEIRRGEISVTETTTRRASPFAADLIWRETNYFMYADDTPSRQRRSTLDGELLDRLVFDDTRRPRISREIYEEFRAKLQRTAPDYSPRSVQDLVEWVKERLLIPRPEWQRLLAAMQRDGRDVFETPSAAPDDASPRFLDSVQSELSEHLCEVVLPGAAVSSVVALENLGELLHLAGSEDPVPAARIVAQFLRYYGPAHADLVSVCFGLSPERSAGVIEELLRERWIVRTPAPDHLQESEHRLCDADNLEHLLRLVRRRARGTVERTLPVKTLPLFLAEVQGLVPLDVEDVTADAPLETMKRRLETLLGYPAPAAQWERDILPFRVAPYHTAFFDALFQESSITWFGCGKETIAFAFAEDLDLFPRVVSNEDEALVAADREALRRLWIDPAARYDALELAQRADRDAGELVELLWRAAWRGEIASDAFVTVRRGVEKKFQAIPPQRSRRAAFRSTLEGRWSRGRQPGGRWYFLNLPESRADDLLEEEEFVRERIRLLFARYGVLFRELLQRELPALRWSAVFRQLRLMELSGEILGGYFFEGVPGLQFASAAAYRLLHRGLAEDRVYTMSAKDPASVCGLRFDGAVANVDPRPFACFPDRKNGTHFVMDGAEVVLISRRNGAVLEIRRPPADARLAVYLKLFERISGRAFQPPAYVRVETINDVAAPKSEYAGVFVDFGFEKDYKYLTLRRR